MADQQHVSRSRPQDRQRFPDVLRTERCVGAAGDGNAVLAVRVDQDECDTGRFTFDPQQASEVDPLGLEGCARRRSKRVAANGANEGRFGTETSGGDGLIPALPAVMLRKPTPNDRLTGARQVPDRDNEVDVDRADDDDSAAHPSFTACPGRRTDA
jgi:hypothetical protein